MPAAERSGKLLELLRENGVARLDDLAASLGVSVNTVRRDLDKLQDQGYAQRIRGGAIYTKAPELELPFEARWHDHADQKRLIAAVAAGLPAMEPGVMPRNASPRLDCELVPPGAQYASASPGQCQSIAYSRPSPDEVT